MARAVLAGVMRFEGTTVVRSADEVLVQTVQAVTRRVEQLREEVAKAEREELRRGGRRKG